MGNTSIIKIQEDLNKIKRQLCCIRTDIDNVEIYNSRVSFSIYSGNFDTEIALGADDISFPVNPHEDDTIVIHFTDVVGYYTYTGTEWALNWSTDIANVPVEFSQIQNIATNKLLGRSTAGSGVIEQISIGTGLSLSGGTLTNTVTASPPGGSTTQIQYNNAGVFAGSSYLTTTATNNLDISGSGSTSATNALRVRNLAGTNLLTVRNDGNTNIGGSNYDAILNVYKSGSSTGDYQLGSFIYQTSGSSINSYIKIGAGSALYDLNVESYNPFFEIRYGNNPSTLGPIVAFKTSYTGDSWIPRKILIGSTSGTALAGAHIFSNTTASTPSMLLSGTGYSGGTATTTKPTFLIEPTGTTSTGWNTSGTKLGVNAESGFTGNLMDLQVNGVSLVNTNYLGRLNFNRASDGANVGYIIAGSSYLNIIHAYSTTIGSSSNGVLFAANGTWMGKSAILNTTPTALVHIGAGTATASTAPLKFSAGVILTTPESGVLETNSSNELFYSNSTTTNSRGYVEVNKYRAITALRTLNADDGTIEVTANTFTVTLPTAVGITGRKYYITNSGSGVTTIATTSSQTFVNVATTPTTLTLNQYSTVTVQSNGTNWLRLTSL